MYLKTFLFFLSACILSESIFSQVDFSTYNFSEADSVALKTPLKDGDYFKLAKELTAPFPDNADKVRAIYSWIDDNIAYDYKAFNKGKTDPFFVCLNNANCNTQEEMYNTALIERILKRKKAVCNGYALLFKTLCTIAGIKSDIVTGHVKTKPYQIGVKCPADHAWNIVMIDSNWYCLDATWGAGYGLEDEETGMLIGWGKHFIPFFFCTPYEKFVRNHFPEHPEELKFMDSKNTKEDFFNFPFFYSLSALNNIENLNPSTGMLKAKVGDTLTFSFKYKKPFTSFQLNTNMERSPSIYEEIKKGKKTTYKIDSFMLTRQKYYPYEMNGDNMTVKYPVTNSSVYYIEFLFDYAETLKYKISVTP